MKTLVTYFSASGVTKKVATTLANAINADLIEIEPVQKYTGQDLDWTNKNSRSTLEMKDLKSRPEIKEIDSLNKYECVFVGFPIWWYREPSIIDTFLEKYDFNDSKIVLFATSGGSGIDGAIKNCKSLNNNLNIIGGKRLSSNTNIEEIRKWADEVMK